MSNSYVKSPAGKRMISPAGSAKIKDLFFPDMQMVVAKLRRCGINCFYSPTGTAPGTTSWGGPLGTNTPAYNDPLYLIFTGTIVWEDGSNASQVVTYDASYYDMTRVWTYSWTTGSTSTNIAPGLPSAMDDSVHPSSGSGYTYVRNVANQPASLTTTTATKLVWSWSGWDEYDGATPPNFIQHHYGGTLTFELTSSINYAAYAAICDGLLAAVDLLDNVTNYPVGSDHYTLDFLSTYPAANGGYVYVTNSITVTQTRSGYVYSPFYYDLSSIHPGWSFVNNPANGLAYINPGTGLPYSSARFCLAASGLPATTPIAYLFSLEVPAPTTACETIFSVKSAIKPTRNPYTDTTYSFTPSSNSWASGSATAPPAAAPIIYSPGGIGYTLADYALPISLVPCLLGFLSGGIGWTFSAGGGTIARLGTAALYAVGKDYFGFLRDNFAATWTIYAMTGAVTSANLVVAGDNKSAVYTAPNAAGSCKIKVSAPGMSSQFITYTTT